MKQIRYLTFIAVGCAFGLSLCAEEESETAAEETAEAKDSAVVEAPAQAKQGQEKLFFTLPLCRVLEGGAEVQYPGNAAWAPIEEGRFYPLGCAYRTTSENSRLTIQFGDSCAVSMQGMAAFGTRVQQVGLTNRTVILKSGTITVTLPRNTPAGVFCVSATGFKVTELTGESTYTFAGTGDGDVATVRCVTGSLAIEGRHFSISGMRAANEVRIRTSQDMLFTGLYGTSGDYVVQLDQGVVTKRDVVTGETTTEPQKLAWHLSPQTRVAIHRAVPKIGSRMSVSVMTFDDAGDLVNRCTFAEGLPELNTGEQGEKALAAIDEKAKDAIEKADATTTEAAPEEASDKEEEKKDTNNEESTEE